MGEIRLAEPEWARYISATTTYPPYGETGPVEGDLISADRDLLIAYMGWYPEVRHEQIRVETIKWETHTDFDIVYWKAPSLCLSRVFPGARCGRAAESYKAPQWFWDWWSYTCDCIRSHGNYQAGLRSSPPLCVPLCPLVVQAFQSFPCTLPESEPARNMYFGGCPVLVSPSLGETGRGL